MFSKLKKTYVINILKTKRDRAMATKREQKLIGGLSFVVGLISPNHRKRPKWPSAEAFVSPPSGR